MHKVNASCYFACVHITYRVQMHRTVRPLYFSILNSKIKIQIISDEIFSVFFTPVFTSVKHYSSIHIPVCYQFLSFEGWWLIIVRRIGFLSTLAVFRVQGHRMS